MYIEEIRNIFLVVVIINLFFFQRNFLQRRLLSHMSAELIYGSDAIRTEQLFFVIYNKSR
jgi:hypothetical protein